MSGTMEIRKAGINERFMNKETEFLIRIVKEAEAITRQSYEVHQKDDKGDLVTSLDIAVEQYLIGEINKNYPGYDIVSEEFHSDGSVTDNCFIIDPIDGTINFANGLPVWGIQIACRTDGETIASVIDLPDLNEFYYADGTGAYLNGKKIRVREVPVKNAVYALMGRNTLPCIENMCRYTRNFRNLGAACAAFAFMASGRIHGVSFRNETPWDYEPGLFLCKMAGAATENRTGFHTVGMNREFLELLERETAGIMNVALQYPIPDRTLIQDGVYIGVDGCRGGWIAAVLDYGELRLERYESIDTLIDRYPQFDAFLIDMAIGLRDNKEMTRPDQAAKQELGPKASTVFPIPSRAAVYAETEEEQKNENIRTLGKSLAKQTINIIPKIRELDSFLISHPEYQNRILESHPEVAFSRLNGSVVMSRKKDSLGFMERERILLEYLEKTSLAYFYEEARKLKCNRDDLMDAACLAVTGALYAHGLCETIPEDPDVDAKGLEMKLTVPVKIGAR